MDNYKDIILVGLYIILGLFILGLVTREVKIFKTWTLSIWGLVWLFVYYVLVPIIMVITGILYGKHIGVWHDVIIVDKDYVSFQTFWAVAIYIGAFSLALSVKFRTFDLEQKVLKVGDRYIPFQKIFVLGTLAFSIFSLLYYTSALGGLVNAFKLAPYLSSPYFADEYAHKFQGSHTMFKRFIPISIYAILFAGFYKKKSSKLLLVLIPLTIYIYYTFLERQRQLTIILILIPVLGYQVYHNKFISRRFLVGLSIAILLFPIITFLNKAFVYDKESYDTVTGWFSFDKYMREFNFPQISLWLAQHADYKKFILSDFYSGIYGNYLPSSMRGFETVNSVNSYLFEGKESTAFPPGIVGNGFYHLGYFGVALFGAVSAVFLNLIDVLFKSLIKFDKRYAYAYIYSFASFFAYIRTGVLGYSLYRPFFVFFIFVLLFSFVLKFKTETQTSA